MKVAQKVAQHKFATIRRAGAGAKTFGLTRYAVTRKDFAPGICLGATKVT